MAAAWIALACAALAPACESPSIDDKICPCALGYTPCQTMTSQSCICLHPGEICVGDADWPASVAPSTSGSMDGVTVYAFSQVDTGSDMANIDDTQLYDPGFKADIVIRAWAQWNKYGADAVDYQFSYVQRVHGMTAMGSRFLGGGTATVLFPAQVHDDGNYNDFTTRDAAGVAVEHAQIDGMPRRGSLANPRFRDYVVGVGEVQIDGGVDGLNFEEVNGDYQGQLGSPGDEGFDDYHLADFNRYLLATSPPDTDLRSRFLMTSDNLLRRDVRAWDLQNNFNYRRYLQDHGWTDDPFNPNNPLAAVWGQTTVNRPAPGASTFVDSAEPWHYWKEIVDRLRDYARNSQKREILISAEGIWPFVDFQSVGIDGNNTDGPDGAVFHYIPVTADGRLDGTATLQPQLRELKRKSELFAPGAPVVMFFDGRQNDYDGFPAGDRQDYWRLYAAEAYANGLFPAFQLRSSVGATPEPTATAFGLMPLYRTLTGFYQAHAALYHGVAASPAAATTSLGAGAMVAVNDRPSPTAGGPPVERDVHVVNHVFNVGSSADTGIVTQADVTVTVASSQAPASVALASPDLAGDAASVPFGYDGAQVTVTLPALDAYTVIMIAY
jgi:hypothetical protein